ncbi:MAG: hypothetical protein U1E21_06035 [Reyranellaceae bacterium]
MQNKIVELDLNEIAAVAGGVTNYATMSSSTTLQSSYTAPTYVRPTYISTNLASPSVSTPIAPRLI